MKIDDFGGLCLTNAHLAFRPKRFSRRFAPQNDNGYAFTLLHMCILPYLRISTLPLMSITTIPTFSHIISDVQSAKFNKNSDEYHARTYIYSDEKRKTAHHNLTINPSSILLGRHILHLPYDMHIVQRLKS